MFVTYRGSIISLLTWQWKAVLLFLISSTTVVIAEHFFDISAILLPTTPVAVVGGAIGIFASFRTNSAYDRWWEGRKLWGQLINTSRHFTTQVLTYLARADGQRNEGPPSALQVELVHRHVAYVHALRVLLRAQDLKSDPDFLRFMSADERAAVSKQSNPTHALLQLQLEALTREVDGGRLSELRMQSFDDSIRALLDIQGGCERIKKTPFPRGYGFIAERLILAYGVLLPLGIVGDIGNDWIAIPMTVLVCLSFSLISEVGRVLEDPFTMFWPALPLSAMATTIEINLRERIGEAELPAMPVPNERGILM